MAGCNGTMSKLVVQKLIPSKNDEFLTPHGIRKKSDSFAYIDQRMIYRRHLASYSFEILEDRNLERLTGWICLC